MHGRPPSREGFTIFPVLLHPRSKGNIRLRSKNPDDPPLINPNYLSEEPDVKILAEGIASVLFGENGMLGTITLMLSVNELMVWLEGRHAVLQCCSI